MTRSFWTNSKQSHLVCHFIAVLSLILPVDLPGITCSLNGIFAWEKLPDSKVHGANMGPIWGRQDPGGPHVGPMNFVIWATISEALVSAWKGENSKVSHYWPSGRRNFFFLMFFLFAGYVWRWGELRDPTYCSHHFACRILTEHATNEWFPTSTPE